MTILLAAVLASGVLWLTILALPWRPWSIGETLDAEPGGHADFDDVTALVPARDEGEVIARTLTALAAQGARLPIVLIDDQSSDDTRARASALGLTQLRVIEGQPRPAGWSGKLWALEQGRAAIDTPLTLLVDADVELTPGVLAALRARLLRDQLALASLMVTLRMVSAWERLLMPAFVYFFRLLYPFRIANSASRRVAAAAGGCILLRTEVLARIGGFAALRGALIDDCTLAALVKRGGYRTWVGLTHSARSHRVYAGLRPIWDMVARTAYTQLRYRSGLLALCTLLMVLAFVIPVAALLTADTRLMLAGFAVISTMGLTYLPTLRYYGQSPAWALALPLAGALFLAMTWASAVRYWRGERSRWKGRSYGAGETGT